MINPTIARLDRTAARLGLDLRTTGRNLRAFDLPNGRSLTYKPGGLGVLRVESYINGKIDAQCVVSIERVERLMRSAVA